ncbi:MAG: hypothetical protein Q9170_002333 [Blastenia crenularia]
MKPSQLDRGRHVNNVPDGELDIESEYGSVVAQCGSRSSSAVVFDDFSELHESQHLTGLPFETYAQQLGSHLTCAEQQSETFDMALDFELLSCHAPAMPIVVSPIATPPLAHEKDDFRCRPTVITLAHVDLLLTDARHLEPLGLESSPPREREPTIKWYDGKQQLHPLFDLENQSGASMRGTSRLLAVLAWQYNRVHTSW